MEAGESIANHTGEVEVVVQPTDTEAERNREAIKLARIARKAQKKEGKKKAEANHPCFTEIKSLKDDFITAHYAQRYMKGMKKDKKEDKGRKKKDDKKESTNFLLTFPPAPAKQGHDRSTCNWCRGKPLDETPLFFVRNAFDLEFMVETLQRYTVIGIDIEMAHYNSYYVRTALIQISTIDCDFIIDPFDFNPTALKALNVPFTNRNILKVFHAGDVDLRTLQRDFGLYCVNCFDTQIAAQALGLGLSLDSLVSHYCGFKLDKSYQRADWGLRPLSEDMLHYARCDTHFLCNIYHLLCMDLLAAQPPTATTTTTTTKATDTTTDELYGEKLLLNVVLDSFSMTLKMPKVKQPKTTWKKDKAVRKAYAHIRQTDTEFTFTAHEDRILDHVYRWRDSFARKKDIVVESVLPSPKMLRMVKTMPKNDTALLREIGSRHYHKLKKHKQSFELLRILRSPEQGTAEKMQQ